ncbi:hypothetical protein MCU_01375 [Bartonella elizabethae Re6043vi]|uniref:Uncharacterized protein n=1 Tax=Bartonella elizabethae Re6043vi TaxID=1094554 RepID=A0ABP2QMA7_BAREL|nr:hypothetical protein [Bartonella elizabethae]EJF82578.1 hypothetical protein MCU_01375 [Bartonella elizabethae Re6043vi]
MAIVTKGVFTDRDNIYCALAAQLKEFYASILHLWQDYVTALDLSSLVIKNR